MFSLINDDELSNMSASEASAQKNWVFYYTFIVFLDANCTFLK